MADNYKSGAPYALSGKRLVFTNWHFIEAEGGVDWYARSSYVPLWSSSHPYDPSIMWKPRYPNKGVRLVCRPAVKSAPLFRRDKEWERRGIAATIIKDEGKFRAWGTTSWHYDKSNPDNGLTYLESDDGFDWTKPNLGICEYKGSKNNNFVSRDVWQLHPGGVFKDPRAPSSERYKWINQENFTTEQIACYLQKFPDRVDSIALARFEKRREEGAAAMMAGARGAVSPDGINWEFIKEPLVLTFTDTHPTCYYDGILGKYVAYFRDYQTTRQADIDKKYTQDCMFKGWKRAIGRSESVDFKAFPLPELVLVPDLSFGPNQLLYTNCKTTIPGAPELHLMFPSVWDTGDDTCSVVAASSYDGKLWQYLPDGQVLGTGDYGSWDGGCVFAYPDLLELPNGDFALPYTGYDVPHKYPRINCIRNTAYALWPKGRIFGLEAVDEGEFQTVAIVPGGNKIFINCLTKRAGFVAVEVMDMNGNIIEGRSMQDCIPVFGDCYRRQIAWAKNDTTGLSPDKALVLRFRMRRAAIFCLDFE